MSDPDFEMVPPQRWTASNVRPAENGGFVSLSDYLDAIAEIERLRKDAERMQEAGWVCKDGFPALKGHKPLKPGSKLYARPEDWWDAAIDSAMQSAKE